ncbi:MAG: hypothetical protein LC624_01665, partial [Halobacteriales archaeon]|nr:hypothetical protein [Halobacteriales archaeon]
MELSPELEEQRKLATGLLRCLDESGKAVREPPKLPADEHRRMYQAMLTARLLDARMMLLQRQGRIGFY